MSTLAPTKKARRKPAAKSRRKPVGKSRLFPDGFYPGYATGLITVAPGVDLTKPTLRPGEDF